MCASLYGQLPLAEILLKAGLSLLAMPAGHLRGCCCELLVLHALLFSFETADDEADADGGDCD
jgi:hypothetical protein